MTHPNPARTTTLCRLGFVAAIVLLPSAALGATSTVNAKVDVDLAEDLSRLSGRVKLTIRNDTANPLDHTDLWLFPERFRSRPTGLSEIEEDWIFPSSFDPGGTKIKSVKDSEGRLLKVSVVSSTLVRVALLTKHVPGETLELRIEFETKIPHRFGPFGRANGQVTLDGGFFPRPPPQVPGGYRHAAPPDVLDFSLTMRCTSDRYTAVVNGEVRALPGGQRRAWVGSGRAERVSLVVLEDFFVTQVRERGVDVVLLHRRERHVEPQDGGLANLGAIDYAGQTVATAAMILPFLEAQDGVRLPSRLLLVEVPLRRDLAIEAPGMVLVSDRAFEVPGIERIRKFHRTALMRHIVAAVLRPLMRSTQTLEWRDRAIDFAALDLVQRWEAAHYGSSGDMAQALAPGSFIAQVDEVLYAPQLPLQQVYFRPVDDTDRLRDQFSLFSHAHPTGHRIFVKLQDLKSVSSVHAMVDKMLLGSSFQEACDGEFGEVSASFLKQWDGPYPKLNYRLLKTRNGRDEEGHFVDVSVERQGAAGFYETVRVAVWDEAGNVAYGSWTGEGRHGSLRIRSKGTVKRVQIDPMRRLLEASDGLVNPRSDNQNFEDWKFLVRGFYLGFASNGGYLSGGLVSTLKPTTTASHSILIEPYESGLGTGLATAYFHHFGPLVRPNLRRYHLGAYLTGGWQRATDSWKSGLHGSVALSIGESTYLSRVNPTSGTRWSLSTAMRGTAGHDESELSFAVAGDVAHLVPAASGHVFGFRLNLASLFGDTSERNRWRLGGARKVRAFGLLSASGTHRVLASMEWRHRFTRDLSINVAQLAWVTSIHGVVFVDAALLADGFADLGSLSSLFVGGGYGLRFIYYVFGLYPVVLGVDFAVPFYTGRETTTKSSLPFSILATVGQSF